MNLQYFSDQDFYFSIKKFFKDLNIPVHYMTEQSAPAMDIISNTYKPNNPAHRLIDDVYFLGMVDDRAFNNQPSTLESVRLKEKDYDGLLIFGVTLERKDGKLPTRGQMAEVTRAFNREFHYTPVVIVFKYDRYICFSNCERTSYKQKWREGEKAGKVSLLKDIDIVNTHTGHLKILQNLAITTSGKKAVTTFDDLYNYWQEVFSVSLLSKRFYQELSNWYFWALQHVEFPDDAEKDREVRNATSVIRLITRLMFVWFLKEKNLVPNVLFDKDELDEHLNYKDYHDSTYYKAILQNLFFATLNTKMKKDDLKSRIFVNRQYGIPLLYRYARFFNNKKKALKLFETIPFLNGGLFENLDKNIAQPNEIRIDCFSNRPVHEKRLKVPDFLFFGAEDQIDLSDVYGSKKRKDETVRGIIHILNSYKFTIAENTPIEEEIALDPELLGKVFENLLASYNPETQTTARKQTGSFYTPREIVNYMVDESLIAYLEGNLIELYEKESGFTTETPPSQKSMFDKQKPVQAKIAPSQSKITAKVKKEIKDKLRHLLSYTTENHLFSKKEVKTIIDALDNAKILDPACGSGAFPMGILHKMVHILTKLDPKNKQWKQRQIEKQTREIKKDISYAEKIKDNKARQKALNELEERLATINDAFDTNELDFGRKLYLIENCIFGVDIQPIAVQIAKLRFFISLIVDQIVDENKENLGILPLPNLETRFVAANTLIGIEKGLGNLFELKIKEKENELSKVRQKHFSARTPATKAKYRAADEQLRAELAQLLIKNGNFGTGVAEKLASWDPYDQNTSADFFDMEWMFGLKDGFDVVIGNPPYVEHKKLKFISHTLKSIFHVYSGTADLYVYFYEKSIDFLSINGVLSFISSNKFMKTRYGEKLRLMLSQLVLSNIIDFTDVRLFDALVASCVVILIKAQKLGNEIVIAHANDKMFIETNIYEFIKQNGFKYPQERLEGGEIWNLESEQVQELKDKIERKGAKLCNIRGVQICRGVTTGYNPAFIIDENIKDILIGRNNKARQVIKPLLQGRNIRKWYYNFDGNYLIFTRRGYDINSIKSIKTHLEAFKKFLKPKNGDTEYGRKPGSYQWFEIQDNVAYYKEFNKPKIIWGLTADKWAFAYDEDNHYLPSNGYILTSESFSVKYILACLNSSLYQFYFGLIGIMTAGGAFTLKHETIREFPIPLVKKMGKKIFLSLVNKIIDIAKSKDYFRNPNKQVKVTSLEIEIDARVAHLYNLTEEEYALILKETDCTDPFRVAALNVYRDIARGKIK